MKKSKYFELEDDMVEKVAKTFDKTEESLNKEVKEIEEWVKTQHLPETMDEKLIQNFYILNKCRLESTKQKIDNYYTTRTRSGNIFKNINPKSTQIKTFMDAMYIIPLPKLTKEMYRVFFFGGRDKNLSGEVGPYDALRHFINLMEVRLHEDIVYGDVWFVDVQNISMKFLIQMTPLAIYNVIVTIYDKIFSLRMKAVYFINAPAIVEVIVAIMKRLKPKLANRFHIFKNLTDILEVLPKEVLPKDYGGDERSLEELRESVILKIYEYQDRFDKLDEMRVDESLRKEQANKGRFHIF